MSIYQKGSLMAWQNQGGSGGPWGGGGNQNNGGGPWGGGGSGGGGRGSGGDGPKPPNLDDLFKKGQNLKGTLPGGIGRFGFLIAIVVILALWLASGFYRIQASERGVVKRFGALNSVTEPGLNYHLPYPIETVTKVDVTRIRSIDIGFEAFGTARRDVPVESLMLTGDQNIIDIDLTVLWRVAEPEKYLFNIRRPEQTVKIAAESALRETIGQTKIDQALTDGKAAIQISIEENLQNVLEEYGSGIVVEEVQLQAVQPPQEVIAAFDDVQKSLQDKDRFQNEAEKFANEVVPKARGAAETVRQQAAAYKDRVINEAKGEAGRFMEVVLAYQQNKEVTLERLYLETMQEVLGNGGAVIMDPKVGQGTLPYLPLPSIQKPATNSSN